MKKERVRVLGRNCQHFFHITDPLCERYDCIRLAKFSSGRLPHAKTMYRGYIFLTVHAIWLLYPLA